MSFSCPAYLTLHLCRDVPVLASHAACLLQVFPAQDVDGKMFFPKPPPKRQLANPVALAALVDLLASEEEAVLHPALTLLVTVVRGGLEIPLSAGARGRIVVRCLRHACEGRCAELCAELLGAEAVAAPPSRLSDGGMGGAGWFFMLQLVPEWLQLAHITFGYTRSSW